MSYYFEIIDGLVQIQEKKAGRTKKNFKEIHQGLYAKHPVDVAQSHELFELKQVINWLNGSNIERSDNCISLFLCNISSNCPFKDLFNHQLYASRIDLDLLSGSLLVWRFEYFTDQPDLVLFNVIDTSTTTQTPQDSYVQSIYSGFSLSQ